MIRDRLYIRIALATLNLCGYDPSSKSTWIKNILKFTHLISTVMLAILLINTIYVESKIITIEITSKILETFVSCMQILIKIVTVMYYKDEMKRLLGEINDFWPIDDAEKATKTRSDAVYSYVLYITAWLNFGAIVACAAFCIFGVYSTELLFYCYVPNTFLLTENVVLIIQLQFIMGGLFLTSGFDSLYMYVCYKCLTQLHIMQHKIANLTHYNDPNAELNKCIAQHSKLIRFVCDMNRIYNAFFVVQYILALLVYGTEMFRFTEATQDYNQLIKSAFYLLTVIIQFVYVYCYLSDEILQNMWAMSEAAYNCEWYNSDLNIRRKLLVVLGISQRKVVLKAGGIADINKAVSLNLFRAAYSTLMFLKTLQNK